MMDLPICLRMHKLACTAFAVALSGCAPLASLATAPFSNASAVGADTARCETVALHRLYFGLDSEGREVSEAEWLAFVRDDLVPRFPDGFTILTAQGHWRSAAGRPLSEASRVVEIVHAVNVDDADARVAAAAARYKSRFRQESVLVLRLPVRACR